MLKCLLLSTGVGNLLHLKSHFNQYSIKQKSLGAAKLFLQQKKKKLYIIFTFLVLIKKTIMCHIDKSS